TSPPLGTSAEQLACDALDGPDAVRHRWISVGHHSDRDSLPTPLQTRDLVDELTASGRPPTALEIDLPTPCHGNGRDPPALVADDVGQEVVGVAAERAGNQTVHREEKASLIGG